MSEVAPVVIVEPEPEPAAVIVEPEQPPVQVDVFIDNTDNSVEIDDEPANECGHHVEIIDKLNQLLALQVVDIVSDAEPEPEPEVEPESEATPEGEAEPETEEVETTGGDVVEVETVAPEPEPSHDTRPNHGRRWGRR